MDGSANKPSRVVHIRGVPSDVTDPEIVHLGLPFGRMTNLVVSKKKNQVCSFLCSMFNNFKEQSVA